MPYPCTLIAQFIEAMHLFRPINIIGMSNAYYRSGNLLTEGVNHVAKA